MSWLRNDASADVPYPIDSTRSRPSRASALKGNVVNALSSGPAARVLERLHEEADATDRERMSAMMAAVEAPGASVEQMVADILAEERRITGGSIAAMPEISSRSRPAMAASST